MYKNSKKKGGIGYQLKVIKQETMVCDWKWYSVIYKSNYEHIY